MSDTIRGSLRAGGKTPVPPVGGAIGLHMLRGLMLRDLALLLVNRLKNIISRECAFEMAPTRSIFQPKMH